jgi:hypothetical protein
MKRAPIAAMVALLTGPAGAGEKSYVTGNQIYEMCGSSFDPFCLGYVVAWSELHSVMEHILKTDEIGYGGKYCRPAKVTHGQALDVFIVYLRDYPERRHKEAITLLLEAFERAFPCG